MEELQDLVLPLLSSERPMGEREILTVLSAKGRGPGAEDLRGALMLLVLRDLAQEREGGYVRKRKEGEPL